MIAGDIRAARPLTDSRGGTVDVTLTAPAADPATIAQLSRVGFLWLDQSEAADETLGPKSDEAYRAFFAATAAFLAADRLAAGTCCVLVAENPATAEVLGVAVYTPGAGDWYINDVTVSPRNQPSFPAKVQIRGIGTLMLNEIAREAAAEPTCTSLSLLPLDPAAEEFWTSRGFRRRGRSRRGRLRLSCDEVGALAERAAAAGDDCPWDGACVTAGDPDEHQLAATPRVAERVFAGRTGS